MSEQQETPLLELVRLEAERGFTQWRREHHESKSDLPTQGKLYAALIVLANLEERTWKFSELGEAGTVDKGKFFGHRSLRRHTISHVSKVLIRHGYPHLLPSASRGERGRTSGGTKSVGLEFIHLIRTALENVTDDERDEQGKMLLVYLYDQVFSLLQKYHEMGGIEARFNASESIATYISELLNSHQGNPGAVLQHMVGAKLELRFTGQSVNIGHHSSAAADIQTGRLGDFEIGSTVFHVTKRANDDHYRKAMQNANNGRKVYLLVPNNVVQGSKAFAEQILPGFSKKVDIFSIEQFLAQNLDELAVFDRSEALRQLRRLLEKYNELIENHENDRSLKIIIPDFGVT